MIFRHNPLQISLVPFIQIRCFGDLFPCFKDTDITVDTVLLPALNRVTDSAIVPLPKSTDVPYNILTGQWVMSEHLGTQY